MEEQSKKNITILETMLENLPQEAELKRDALKHAIISSKKTMAEKPKFHEKYYQGNNEIVIKCAEFNCSYVFGVVNEIKKELGKDKISKREIFKYLNSKYCYTYFCPECGKPQNFNYNTDDDELY